MRKEKQKSQERGTRSRSFGGCVTCRIRHLKCDERHPICLTCIGSGLQCGGYEKEVFFDSAETSNISRFRRPLFTEEERICMSQDLVDRMPPKSVLWNVEQLDQECEEASHTSDFEAHHGPFGAFRLANTPFIADEECPRNSNGEIAAVELGPTDTPPALPENLALVSHGQQTSTSEFAVMSPPLYFDMLDFHLECSTNDGLLDSDLFSHNLVSSPGIRSPTNEFDPAVWTATQEVQEQAAHHEVFKTVSLPATVRNSLPHDAIYLVKHYSTTVLRVLTPFRHTKTPWHVIFLLHAKACLASLTLGDNMDDASLCAFYGILAISAWSLSGASLSSSWLDSARAYAKLAEQHGKQMISAAYTIPKTSKYKSILVALLTMIQLSMMSGSPQQTDIYLLETEKFIRVKGLNRKKSRKVRLLHHCYAYERMIHESIFVSGLRSSHRVQIRRSIEASGAVVYSHDSLTFRLGDWNNLEVEMARIKSKEEGENDLHLEIPGVWSATLYPEIFGVPEVFVFLLSLTIRLGEQKDATGHQHSSAPLNLREFLSRAKAVERCIESLRDYTFLHSTESVDTATNTILEAMYNALSIYFYRRIYDVESSLLEHKVKAVKGCLVSLEMRGLDSVNGAARLIWPAFIAGCESEVETSRVAIGKWLDRSANCSGLRLFLEAKASMERVWARKATSYGENTSWFDILRADNQQTATT